MEEEVKEKVSIIPAPSGLFAVVEYKYFDTDKNKNMPECIITPILALKATLHQTKNRNTAYVQAIFTDFECSGHDNEASDEEHQGTIKFMGTLEDCKEKIKTIREEGLAAANRIQNETGSKAEKTV